MKNLREHLDRWRAAQPTVEGSCRRCGESFQHRAGSGRVYCSSECKWRWHREQKQLAREAHCDWCLAPLAKRRVRFCSQRHKELFHNAQRGGRAIRLRIDGSTVIETREYARIQQVVGEWRRKLTDYSL